MQVTLQGLFSSDEGSAVTIETNSNATVQTLVSAFCAQRGIAFNQKLEVFDGSKRPLPLHNTLQSAGVVNGQSLYIGYRSRFNNGSKKPRWPLYVALLALFIGIVGILTMSLIYGLFGGVIPFDYGVVMDAGSSKTTTLLYRWLANKYRNTGYVAQVGSCQVKGGIDKGDPSQQINKILECTANATKPIDPKLLPATPLYFAATAGMRLLNRSDPDRADDILQQMHERLNDTGMSVRKVSIISGWEEGIYDWITSNYLKKTLDVKNTDPFTPVTYGALDMGGASCQIAFALPPTEENLKNPAVEQMMLYGEQHAVYAKSDLCFGRDIADTRYHALLVQDPTETIVVDPCVPLGASQNISAKVLLDSYCTETPKFAEWFTDDPDLESTVYQFQGSSNYEECESYVKKLMDKDLCNEMKFNECFENLPRPLESQKFLAFASYFYTTEFLNLTKSTMEKYKEVTRTFCGKRLSEIPDNPYAAQYCFNAVYIYEVLVNGYGFNSSTWNNLEFAGAIGDKDIAWALGYMINATNPIPSKKPSPRLIDPTLLTVCLVIFIIVVAATMIFIFHTFNRKKGEANENGSAQSLYQSP